MKCSLDRILTTHTGSFARPPDLVDLLLTQESGQTYDHEAFARRVRTA
jgi:5-methyltetrahydropteroyltriglutamate--homocysteine methyltransferase